MRVGSRDVRVHQRRALARPAIFRGAPQEPHSSPSGSLPSHSSTKRPGIIRHQFRNAPARRLEFHGNGNRPAVILDHEKDRKLAQAGRIQSFEKFPFARGTVAARNVDDFVRLVAHVFAERRLLRLLQRMRKLLEIEGSLRHAHGLRVLHPRGRGSRKNIQPGNAPVRRHLAPAGVRIVLGPHRLEKHFERRDAQRQAKRAIAIVGIHPVIARAAEPAPRRPARLHAPRR